MNIFSTRKAEKVRKAFFSGFLILSLVLSQAALPLTVAYATAPTESEKINICHKTETSWQFMDTPAGPSLNGHLGHGDFLFDSAWGEGTNQKCIDHAPVVPPQTATIEATKIVCDTEADLPNWGAHDVATAITATTATDFIAAHTAHCQIKPWTFEWAANSATNPGDNVTTGGSGWTSFTSTATVPVGGTLWVREQTQPGYVPFSGVTTSGDLTSASAKNSAEIYCDNDVLNYDNFDRTDAITGGETHHCVAFNAKVPEPVQCIAGVNLIQNGDFEAPALPTNTWQIIPDTNSFLKWAVAWIPGSPLSLGAFLGLEIQNHVAGNPAVDGGQQFAELDGDSPVTISQTIPTIVGKQYSLTFKYSPRPTGDLTQGSNTAADNSMVVKINGVVNGATIDGTTAEVTDWRTITRTFIADSTTTKIEITDTGTDNGTGGYIDNVSLTCAGDPAPQCKEDASAEYVSDATTMVGANPAVPLSFIHSGWTATIPGATWIWATDPVESPTNDADLTKVFTKTFSVVGTPTGGQLMVAADNNYSVKVNGNVVPVSFDQNNFQAETQDSYDVSAFLVSGVNTLEISVTNWETGQDANPANNPAGLLYKLTLNNNECITPPPTVHTSTVTMCKTDDAQPAKPLPGWTLMLQGASVGSVDVLPNGADFKIAGVPAGDYILKAVGEYLYRPGTAGAEYSDAAYSKRDPSDAVYTAAAADNGPGGQAAYLPWTLENNFPTPYEGWLGVTYNNASTNWGSIFNPTHEYALGTTTGALGDLSFKILDNNYSDNSGKITVDALHGYTGVTGENGCVELKNVPYGIYTADEILKAGWSKVSGTGTVVVDEPTEHFTIVNHDTTVPVNGKVHLFKFINGVQATVENADSVAFPMFTATYNAPFFLRPSGWDTGDAPYEASTGAALTAGSTYTANEDLSISPALVGESCDSQNHPAYKLVGYTTGSSLAEAQGKTPTLGTPTVTINGDQYIIVWNQKCGQVEGAHTLKVHLYKYLTNSDGPATQVPDDSSAPAFPMTATWKTANLNGGVSSSSPYILGNYHGGVALKYAADTAPMEAPADYTSSEVTSTDSDFLPIGAQCVPGKYRLVGYKSSAVSLANAEVMPLASIAPEFVNLNDDRWVIVENEKCADAPATGTIEITKYTCPANFVPNRTNNGVGSEAPEGCTLTSGTAFGYVHGDQTDANAPYPELNASLTAGGSTGVNGKLVIGPVLSAGRYLVKETDATNLAGLYCEGDGDTNPNNNDNQELTFVPANGVAHCVAYNKAPVTPPTCPATYTDDSDNSGAIRFENSQGYSAGSVNGVNGWSATGAYDYGVVANTFGYPSFNDQAFRISDGTTSGSFGDWAFATPNANGAGEADSTAGTFSKGTLQNHFEAQFDIASTTPCEQQEGLHFSVSPDRGDGSRMSYLRFEDQSDGLHVFFDDVSGIDNASVTFNETDVATLSRSIPHKIKFVMDFVNGPSNDVVKIYIDGSLVKTGTSWENYYRYDNESSAEQTPRIVKTLIFQARGTAHPANTGKGFLVDNLTLGSSVPAPLCSDGIDNDGDQKVDASDPGCHSDGNASNSESYVPSDNDESNSPVSIDSLPVCSDGADNDHDGKTDFPTDPGCSSASDNDEFNGGGSGPIFTNSAPSIGKVLGASTQCGLLLDDFLKMGKKNNKDEVMKLQQFLNKYLKLKPKIAVNGVFGIQTYKAVVKFQEQESEYILKPWVGLTLKDSKKGTGWVYKTTVTRINNIECPELNLQNPPLTID